YISALGATNDLVILIVKRIVHIADGIIEQRLLTVNLPSDSAGQLVLQQISLMLELLPELTRLKASLA
ncbi:hypothetical protein, partial [Edwardsiella piscicida]|uniref:hypothetical protein n=1 Tax=Edwardsiella piscicida TaxID=1263550 RepID=UPI0011B1DF0A